MSNDYRRVRDEYAARFGAPPAFYTFTTGPKQEAEYAAAMRMALDRGRALTADEVGALSAKNYPPPGTVA